MNIIAALILFGIIVMFHEFGHFIVAKLCGVRVLEFSVGMGPRILKKQGKETVYSLRALPLGGYCSMQGEDFEEAPKEGDFLFQKPWKRFLVILAGPFFNFILAFFLSIFIISNVGIDRCDLTGTIEGLPAAETSLSSGDRIIRLNDQKITVYRDLTLYNYLHPGVPLHVTAKSIETGEVKECDITPVYSEEYGKYMLGIEVDARGKEPESLGELLYYSNYEVWFNISATLKGLLMMLHGQVGANEITGPVGIVGTISEAVDEAAPFGMLVVLLELANLAVLLSANLGVMNLLPLPALDGGRLIFILVEMIFRRPVSRKVEGYIHVAGFMLLMGLMVFVMMNDIRNLL